MASSSSPGLRCGRTESVVIRRVRLGYSSSPSKLRISRRAPERDYVANVLHAGHIHQHALKPETESRVRGAAELTQLEVPPVGVLVQLLSADLVHQYVVALLPLAAADDLADPRRQHVHGANRLSIVVRAHIERFDLLWIVRHD